MEKELEHVINYVNLEKCRYGDSVELRIHVPEELRQIIIPRFLLQPIVENSFEHGFTGMAPEEKRQINHHGPQDGGSNDSSCTG